MTPKEAKKIVSVFDKITSPENMDKIYHDYKEISECRDKSLKILNDGEELTIEKMKQVLELTKPILDKLLGDKK